MRRTFWQMMNTDGQDEVENAKRRKIADLYKDGDEEYKREMVKSYHNVSDKAAWRTFVSEAGAYPPAP